MKQNLNAVEHKKMVWKYIFTLSLAKSSSRYLKHAYIPYRNLTEFTNDLSVKWSSRSHWCGTLRECNVGEEVHLTGWVQYFRLDNKFVLLRDASGVVQLILPEEGVIADCVREKIKEIGPESSIKAIGTVIQRPKGQCNPSLDTGMVEVDVKDIAFVNPAIKSLPFLPSRVTNEGKEPLRMKHRSLDLRRQELQNNLRLRSKVVMNIRQFLCKYGFIDIETPTLFRRTPGGAREFIVPTRLKGKFYSLVQSPQQFKQMLMVGGFDKYFQIARCYRDEGAKPDRQPEFTQVDIEMSWCNRSGIQDCIEELLRYSWPEHLNTELSDKGSPG